MGNTTITEENNLTTVTTFEGIKVILLEEKKDIFKYINPGLSLIYALGDSYNDLDMLMTCLFLGGRSSVINNEFYRTTENFNKILTNILGREEKILIDKLAYERYPNYPTLSPPKKSELKHKIAQEIITNDYISNQRIKIFNKALKGEIDLNREQAINYIHNMIVSNNDISNLFYSTNSAFPENKAYDIDVYPTFYDYYERVLKY